MNAEDSKIISEVSQSGQVSALQGDINKIKDWCDKWLMSLNSKK